MADDLISRTTRGLFRNLMTGSTVGQIAAAFQDEGFAPDPDCAYEDSSVRRQTTQAYLDAVDWSDPGHVTRALRVVGRLMHGHEAGYTEQLRHSLRRDGYVTDPETGHIMSAGPQFAADSLAGLKDASTIWEQLDRIQRAIADDPALAVGSAQELIESTGKVVLAERACRSATRPTCRNWSARRSRRWACTRAPLRLDPTAPTRSSASSAGSPPSRPGAPSCATAATAPVTGPREHVSACGPAMRISPSTRPSPGAS